MTYLILVDLIQMVFLIVIGFFLLYLAVLTLASFFRKEEVDFRTQRHRRFAIVVPAHDEALVIEATLLSLFAIEYPTDQYDVIVIADNCGDETAALSAKLGATVFQRNVPSLRGKGHALRWSFDLLLNHPREYEAIVVIDADSVVSKNFLTVMNHYMESGARAIQCSDLADPGSQGWSAEMIRLSFLLNNFVRPLGRSAIGCSVGLKGNGMCFAAEVVTSIPWSSFSLNEDLEYGLELVLRGVTVQFAPEAKLLAKMPQNEEDARSQRVRWEVGRFPIIKKYGHKLVTAALRNRSLELFDSFVELTTPSLVNMIAIASGFVALDISMSLIGIEGATTFILLWMGVLCLGVTHVTLGFIAARAEASAFLSLLHVPKYFLWKLKLYIGLGRSKDGRERWIRTRREVSPRDLGRKRSREDKS